MDDLENQGDELEQRGREVDAQLSETREEFEQKKSSAETPGAQDPDELVVEPPPRDEDEDES